MPTLLPVRCDLSAVRRLLTSNVGNEDGNLLNKEELIMNAVQYVPLLEVDEGQPSELIEVLQDIQSECGHLPEPMLREAADRLNVPLIEVFRVASFYKSFSLVPRGRHLVTVCTGTACHVRGASWLLDELQGQLNVTAGETTEDGMFTVEAVNCLGACALGPVVVVDGKYHDHMTPMKLRDLIETTRKQHSEEM